MTPEGLVCGTEAAHQVAACPHFAVSVTDPPHTVWPRASSVLEAVSPYTSGGGQMPPPSQCGMAPVHLSLPLEGLSTGPGPKGAQCCGHHLQNSLC